MKSGIYKITNKRTKKIYIGSSIDIKRRWNSHNSCLQRKKHYNSYLQNAWNKYGKDNFEFEVVEECSKELLIEKEQYWLNKTQCYNRKIGYNQSKSADRTFFTEETRKKMSLARKGKKLSLESEKKRIESRKGYRHSKETIEKIRNSNKGRVISLKTRKKMSLSKLGKKGPASNSFGHKVSIESRNIIARKNRGGNGKNSILNEKQVMNIRKKYIPRIYTQNMLALEYKVSRRCIRSILDKRTWKHLEE